MSAEARDQIAVRKGMRLVDPAVLDHMRHTVRGRTDEALNDQFGLSYNSWRKMLAGAAVRVSLADRLEHKVRMQWQRDSKNTADGGFVS